MDMDLKLFGSGMDVKPGTPPVSGRSTTPTSSPYRYHPQALRVTPTTLYIFNLFTGGLIKEATLRTERQTTASVDQV